MDERDKRKRGFTVTGSGAKGDQEAPKGGPSKRKALGTLMRLGADAAVGAASGLVSGRHKGDIARDAGARRRQIAKMGAAAGRTMAAAKVGSVGRSEADRDVIRQKAARRATSQVAEALGNMKGIAMKMGQLMSYAATLSDDAERELASLQATSEPMSYDAVEHVLTKEFKRPPEEVFASFEREPVAAASVGQVHRAVLRDGREVAVKVQYPGVEDAIMSDIANLGELSSLAALSGGHVDMQPLYDEIFTLIHEELDYRKEAASQKAFADAYRGHPYVRIPEVIEEYSTLRVLTSEFVAGRTLHELGDEPPEARDALGEIIYRFAYGSVLGGAFSGDPHPGNYIFCDDGRVCFIDFGLVKRPTADEAGQIRDLLTAGLQDDEEGIAKALDAIGLAAADVDPSQVWRELAPCAFGPIAADGPRRLSREEQREALRTLQNQEGEFHKLMRETHPPAWLGVFVRYCFGTLAVVSKLGAESNWHGLMKELVGVEGPSTEIGRNWLAQTTGGTR